jgi:Holliday junction resolvase RusA-like endonuclease
VSIAYVVPVKPIGQNRNGARTGPWTKTTAQRDFATALAVYGHQARQRAGWVTTTAPVQVGIRIYFQSERPDTDSPVKAILDSLEVSRPKLRRPGAGFLANDRQVRRYVVDRLIDAKEPRVEIEIRGFSSPCDWDQA